MVIAFILTGLIAGICAGMFGVGGGIIIVPALLLLLKYQGIPADQIMHIAVATSLACIVFTTASAVISHLKYRNIHFPTFKHLPLPLTVGTLAGVITANYLPAHSLQYAFTVFLLYIAIKLFLKKSPLTEEVAPRTSFWGFSLPSVFISFFSPLLGIGGGAMLTPFFHHKGLPMVKAAALSSIASLFIAIVGTLATMLVNYLQLFKPSHQIYSIHWEATLLIGLGAILGAPLGVRLAMKTNNRLLKKIFALLLIAIAINMVI